MKSQIVTLLGQLTAASFIFLACGVPGFGQTARPCAETTGAPCIDKIDPPNWWVGMPDPMLLVHGSGLRGAHFTLRGTGVAIQRTQVSTNGHWAFLWLATAHAASQTLEISVGSAHAAYTLAEPSRDPHAHAGFSAKDVMYLIMPDRFSRGSTAPYPPGDDRSAPRGWHGGDLAGIEQHLDYLKHLGVTTVWTTPVASNAGMNESYHGYAATDLYAVDPHLGTLADYKRLSDALHARGMKLVIDLVPNHIGSKHPWVADPPAPDWLHGTVAHHSALAYEFYDLLDPHSPPAAWRNNTDGWFSDYMPDLNQENPLVSRYLIQNALWWVETANLDGIRLDTFPYVSRAFWHDFHAALHTAFPHLTTVGEVYHRDPEVTSFFAGGEARDGADGDIDTGLDTPFDYPLCFALRDVLTQGKPMTELTGILRQDALYPHPERLVTFIGNHDLPRVLTEAKGSVPMLKLGVGLLATLRGMPELYTGDEIGMTGGPDPDNRHDFPGGFPGDAQNAFIAAGRTPTQEDIFRWTSGLLAYRAARNELKAGIEQNLYADADSFAFVRGADAAGCDAHGRSERLLVVVNKSGQSQSLELPVSNTALAGCTSFAAAPITPGEQPQLSNGKLRIEEPAESMTIYAVR
ncbi:MAG TPA: alpha-amylase family glycosyl hydrolase [Terracidiphilus sp.]|nr:alpha-amylase family glycosyl hydrolase [Terracidiphilus sp.]